MKVAVYVDWEYEEVLSEAEYKKKVAEASAEYVKEDDCLDDFLDQYTKVELFRLTETERTEVLAEFAKSCAELAEENLAEKYDKHIIEV